MTQRFFCLLAIVTSVAVRAEEKTSTAFTWKSLEISGIYVTQGANQNSTSAEAAWTPAFRINSSLAVRGNFGVAALRANDIYGNQTTFTMIDVEALFRYYLTPDWDLDIGGGIQTWVNQGGGNGVVSANLGYDLTSPWLGFVDRLFDGYSDAFQNVNANEFRAGFGLNF